MKLKITFEKMETRRRFLESDSTDGGIRVACILKKSVDR